MIDRTEIERLAREQVCGGNEPQTPYERGAVQQLVAFGIRVKLQGHHSVGVVLVAVPVHYHDRIHALYRLLR